MYLPFVNAWISRTLEFVFGKQSSLNQVIYHVPTAVLPSLTVHENDCVVLGRLDYHLRVIHIDYIRLLVARGIAVSLHPLSVHSAFAGCSLLVPLGRFILGCYDFRHFY